MQQIGRVPLRSAPAPRASGPHPAVSLARAHRRPAQRPLRVSIVSKLGLAALCGIVAFALATGGGRDMRAGSLSGALDRAALALGFGIAQIEIAGHHYTADAAIHETLDLANAGSLLRIESGAVRDRIERLPWIETASVTRVFPDRLRILVTERKAFARWQRAEQVYLIDRTGRILTPIRPGAAPHLPLVVGEGAAEAAEALLALVERYPAIMSRLEAADRIDGRRWTLRLEDGPRLLLPATGEIEALSRIATAGVLQGAAAMSAGTIDARVAGRMILDRQALAVPRQAAGRGECATGKARSAGAVGLAAASEVQC